MLTGSLAGVLTATAGCSLLEQRSAKDETPKNSGDTTASSSHGGAELVPVRQGQGQPGQWADCGPVCVLMVLLALGKTPEGWNPDDPVPAIMAIQGAGRMDLPRPEAMEGSTLTQMAAGLGSYQVRTRRVLDAEAALKAAREQRMAVINVMTHQFSWPQDLPDKVPHVVVLAGHDEATDEYLIMDPMSRAEDNSVHRASADEITAAMTSRSDVGGLVAES